MLDTTPDVAETWRDKVTQPISIGSNVRCIGTATLPRQQSFRKDMSYAAWWLDVLCEPQTVSVLSDGYYVWWTFDGVVTGGNIDSRVGGVAITANQIDRDLGRAEKYTMQPYAYSIPVGRSRYHGGIVLDIDPTLIGA